MTLPQGLQLPVSVVKETFCFYKEDMAEMSKVDAERILSVYADTVTEQQMKAGEILKKTRQSGKQKGLYVLKSTLECHEMIAEVVEAKWNNEEFVND